jgi:hypothetical protein
MKPTYSRVRIGKNLSDKLGMEKFFGGSVLVFLQS